MASLDTNVLVRWLVDDDPAQSETVRQLLAKAAAHEEPLFIPSTVLLELEWVLRKNYGRDKPDVLRMLNALLDSRELVFENEAAIERALHLYRLGNADFGECLHVGISSAAARDPLWTFDRKASRLSGAQLLR